MQIMEVAKYVLHRVIIWLFDIQCSSESTRRVDDLQEVTFCYHRPRLMTETMPFIFPYLITIALPTLDGSSCVQTNIGRLLLTKPMNSISCPI